MIFGRFSQLNDTFKLQGMKTYTSVEWLYGEEKSYHNVFEQSSIDYIYVEVTCYNKVFEKRDWQAKINLQVYQLINANQRELVGEINTNQLITKELSTFAIREGWGNAEKGAFWQKGAYCWDIYINGELIGEKIFYVENQGVVSQTNNPYFEVISVNLYENGKEPLPDHVERKYTDTFEAQHTRYIWADLTIKPKTNENFYAEFFFNFYNQLNQLKGRHMEVYLIDIEDDEIIINMGWGAEEMGSWFQGTHFFNIVFMNQIISKIEFQVT